MKKAIDGLFYGLGERFGVDFSYYLKNGGWVTLRYVSVSFLGLLLSIAFARLASKELIGQYQAILAFLGLVSVVSLPGLNMAAIKALVEGKKGVVRQAVKKSFLFSLLGIPLVLGYAAYAHFTSREPDFILALIIGALLFPLFYAPNTWYVAYEGKKIFQPVALRVILSTGLSSLTLFLGLFFHASLPLLLFLYLSVNSAASLIFYREAVSKEEKGEGNVLDSSFAFKVSLQKFAFSLSENIPPLLIAFLFGFEWLALFQIAFIFINAITGLLSGLSATYLPMLFEKKAFRFGKAFLQNLILGGVFFVVFRIALEILFPFFYGEQFRESLVLARELSYLILLFPLRTFFTNFFSAREKNFLLISVSVLANLLAFGGMFLFQELGFQKAVLCYIYLLNLLFLVPLTVAYFSTASKKTASI